jgi:cytochrome c biogenesis protein CcdA
MTLRSALIALLLAAIAALSIGMTAGWLQAPANLMTAIPITIARPVVTLPTIVVAGVLDGINPCAFTLLLLFITVLLAGIGSGGPDSVAAARRRMMLNGAAFIGAIFLAYLLLGTGLMQVSTVLAQDHLGVRLGALLSILLGLWMLKDYYLPGVGPRLAAPRLIAGRVRGVNASASVLTMFGLGG